MMRIDLRTSWRNIRGAIDAHNNGCVAGLRKDGSPAHDLKRKLRPEHRELLHVILVLHARQMENKPAPAPFRTNSPALASVVGCAPRTVRNLVSRLLDSGLIATKEHRGRKNDYLLSLRPGLLAMKDVPAAEAGGQHGDTLRKTSPQLPFPSNKKNKLPCGQAVTLENADAARHVAFFTGNTNLQEAQANDRPAITCPEETNLQEEGGAAKSVPLPSGMDGPRFDGYFNRLLSFAVPTLYHRLDFLAESQVEAMRAYFRQAFASVAPEDWEHAYHGFRIRLMLAGDWLKRDPRRYIPIPQRYFQHGNPKGFDGTARWVERMALTTRKAQEYRRRYTTVLKAFGAFMHTIGDTLAQTDLHHYALGRKKAESQLAGLGRAFDHVILTSNGILQT